MNRKRYKEFRLLIGTQAEAGKKLGVAGNTVSRREQGSLPINREAALAIEALVKEESASR